MKYPESVLFKIKENAYFYGDSMNNFEPISVWMKKILFSFRDNLGHMFDSWYVDWYMVYWQASG